MLGKLMAGSRQIIVLLMTNKADEITVINTYNSWFKSNERWS